MPIRVYKLAKELRVTSKDIMSEALNHGIEVQNHMGSLSEAEANLLRAFLYTPEPDPVPEPEPVIEAPAPEPEVKVNTATEEVATPISKEPGVLSLTGMPTQPAPVAEVPEVEEAVVAPPAPPREIKTVRPPSSTPAVAAEVESPDEVEETKPREARVVKPISSRSKTSSTGSATSERQKPTRAPTRRGPNIVGHREVKAKPDPGPRSDRTPVNDSPGMVQTRSEGHRRVFVPAPNRGGGPRHRGGAFGRTGGRKSSRAQQQRPKSKEATEIERPSSIQVQMPISVKDLSAAMALKAGDILAALMKDHGMMPNINSMLDKETVELIGLSFECEITVEDEVTLEQELEEVEEYTDAGEDLEPRAPIIAMLGHVDHGKTSLLDRIRGARIAEREHGGITQHIGAWRVQVPTGEVVFLDTPGHQAFTEMRARGANVTDIVVLVVAADDGVMPQTEEAVAHAKAAETPIVVAINKCDKPEANPAQVKQQLVGLGLQPEEWGGETGVFELSAQTGKGVDELLEYLALTAEVLELKANPKRPGEATIVEALQKKGEGNVVHVIVKNGTLRTGDQFLCGAVFGRIKAIRGSDGETLKEALPGWPVEIPGLNELPSSGEILRVVKDSGRAKEVAEQRKTTRREARLTQNTHTSLENLLQQANIDQVKIILKVDTHGSMEVLQTAIEDLSHEEIEPKIIHAAVGGVTETDVTLADASDAVILGFHVTDNTAARRLAAERGVEIRHYTVIYTLLEELTEALEGRLAPDEQEVITGHVEVRKIFRVSRIGTIAGCHVLDGNIRRIARVRLTRNGILIHEGDLDTLKHHKDDVKEIKEGGECGIKILDYDDIKVGDIIEPYEIRKIKRTFGG
jgi:translation initiation factor IF-2